MDKILQQLELDQTFFTQIGLFALIFLLLSQIYFKPFLRLLQVRHQRTVADRQEADRLVVEAEARLQQYQKRMAEERALARKEYEALVAEAKMHEQALLGAAREQAKKITQEALDDIQRQKEQLRAKLDIEVESLAQGLSERLISKKA